MISLAQFSMSSLTFHSVNRNLKQEDFVRSSGEFRFLSTMILSSISCEVTDGDF